MKLNELPPKKRFLFIIGVFIVIVLILVASAIIPQKKSSGEEEASPVSQPIPEADLAEGPDGKTDSYVRSGISDYWESLDEQQEMDLGGGGGSDSRRPGEVSVEDIFGDMKRGAEEQPVRKPSGGGGGGSTNKPTKEEPPLEQAPAESLAETPAESEPTPARVQVKRSGAISSLDEDVVQDVGNGFSTLDSDDMWIQGEAGKPYRCMFTRDEKVTSGQRITLRLLEDLVIGGVHIPQNTHLQGVCKISDRMEVSITSLDMGGRILSFHFEAYDTDGGKGIYCSDLSQTKKDITNQGVSTALNSLNSRLGSAARDAATLGASIVRSKSGEISVTVPSGYTFYIVEEKKY